MFLEVVPVIRSIRGKDTFTYSGSDSNGYRIGDVVWIPWRNKTILGVVWKITSSKPSFPTKEVISVTEFSLSPEFIKFIEWFAQYYHVAKSHVLKISLPDFPKRKAKEKINQHKKENGEAFSIVRKNKIKSIISKYLDNPKSGTTFLYQRQDDVLSSIKELLIQCSGRTAIIVSEDIFAQYLCLVFDEHNPRIVTSGLGKNVLYNSWKKVFDKSEKLVLIGTKRLSLFPLTDFEQVIVIDPEDKFHKQWDMNPRYHVFRVAKKILELSSGNTIFFSQSPTIEQFKDKQVITEFIDEQEDPDVILVDVSSRQYDEFFGLLSESVKQGCDDSSVPFLWYNQKGSGSFFVCGNCKNLIKGIDQKKCSNCGSFDLQVRGHGTESLVKALRNAYPNRPIIEITKDNELANIDYKQHPIIVGTSYAFKVLDWSKIDYTAVIMIDHLIAMPNFRSEENVLHDLIKLRNYTNSLVVQTNVPEHRLFRALKEIFPIKWYSEIDVERQQLKLPPYGERILLRNKSTKETKVVYSDKDLPINSDWIIDREL
ncbi:MAG: hypothetical protein Q8P90_03575 [bacterium]|nr:hypothetical protein [bacterium]